MEIKWFADDTTASFTGSKARRLGIMFRKGFPVPDGWVIPPEKFDLFLKHNPGIPDLINHFREHPDKYGTEITIAFQQAVMPSAIADELAVNFEKLLDKGFRAVAVRSSASVEDGGKTSFAGQFESFLDITTPGRLSEAVKLCWMSAFSNRVAAYCAGNNIPLKDLSMSVVVQGQIDAEHSGVLFTANPLTANDREMVIETAEGMGDQLVQGTVTPERICYNWYDEVFSREPGDQVSENTSHQRTDMIFPAWLSAEKLKQLCDICLDLQLLFGEPLDIEWVFAEGLFHIVQARPLTAIQYKTSYEWTNADLKDGGISSSVTTPMMYSLYRHIFSTTMHKWLKDIRVLTGQPPEEWFRWWFGYCYWNLTVPKEGLKKLPGFEERAFDEGLGIRPAYEGKGYVSRYTPLTIWRGLKALTATKKSINRRADECKEVARELRDWFGRHQQHDVSAMEMKELAQHIRELILKRYTLAEGSYFLTIYDNNNAATFFTDALSAYNRKHKKNLSYLKLIGGLSNLSHLKPVYDLWDLGRAIRGDNDAYDFYISNDRQKLSELILRNAEFPFSAELNSYIMQHGYHSYKELDITVKNWNEDPAQVLDILCHFLHQPEGEGPRLASQRQQNQYQNEKNNIKSRKLLILLKSHRSLLWWREEMRDLSTRMYDHIRKTLLATGEKMVSEGLLQQTDDVFMLTFQELIENLENPETKNIRLTIEKNLIYYNSFKNFEKPNEILRRPTAARQYTNGGDMLNGIAGSSGVVRGKARVVKSLYEATSVEKGEIMVTLFTDPSWTAWFTFISGLVTETGGILSHGAVVSREYGIPAVMGVSDATRRIRTGDTIEVDGNEGKVIIIR